MSVDAHKWMFVPKACGAVLVRRTSDLAAAFSHNEAYIPHEDDELNAVDVTLEYSRPFRALKLWLALRVHGAAAFRSAIEENLAQAQLLYGLAAAHPDFQTLAHPPMLSIVPIRHVPPGCPDPDRHNELLCRAMQRDGRVYVSPAVIDGQHLAAAVLHELPDHRGRRAHDADGRRGDRRDPVTGALTAVGYPPRMAEDARASSEGVSFPEGGDGRRSTTATGRAVFADSVRRVDPALAARIEHTSDWRTGYITPLRDIVRAAAITPSAAIAVSQDGLESARRRFSFDRNGVHAVPPSGDGPLHRARLRIGHRARDGTPRDRDLAAVPRQAAVRRRAAAADRPLGRRRHRRAGLRPPPCTCCSTTPTGSTCATSTSPSWAPGPRWVRPGRCSGGGRASTPSTSPARTSGSGSSRPRAAPPVPCASPSQLDRNGQPPFVVGGLVHPG